MTQIFVGNLPFTATESDVRGAFERFGRVSSVRLVSDSQTNRSRGFAFVMMPSLDDADEAISRMSGTTLMGRQLTVNESRDRREDGPSPDHSDRDSARALFKAMMED